LYIDYTEADIRWGRDLMIGLPNINTVTTQDILTLKEGQYFDRKSAIIKAKKIAEVLIAFANADGGVVAIGVNDGEIEGISEQGNIKINDFVQCKITNCSPAIKTNERFLEVVNHKGQNDHILLINVEPSHKTVYKTNGDEVYLRVGDESLKLNHEQRLDLEYDKGERIFEELPVSVCTTEDIDKDSLINYKNTVHFTGENLMQPLYARGFINNTLDNPEFTVAGVLLFAKYPTRFFPSARIRFLRFEGSKEEVGTEMNVVKQEYIEGPLPFLIEQTKTILTAQLREFTALNHLNGRFTTVPEYPEFAWLEGIVNAITHRAYNVQGDDIKIKMFDDRLEISSPGKFPNIVNRHNIKEVRYSRNPRIARALTEMGWVRELGEGVKRIYKEMDALFLDDPEFIEAENSVTLILKNNIVMRRMRRHERINTLITKEWSSLTEEEQTAVEYIYSRGQLTTKQLSEKVDRSPNYSKRVLEGLTQKGILELVRSSINDPNQHYKLITH